MALFQTSLTPFFVWLPPKEKDHLISNHKTIFFLTTEWRCCKSTTLKKNNGVETRNKKMVSWDRLCCFLSGFVWEGKLVARCLNLGKFSTQTFHKCSRKMQNDGTAPSMMIRFNRNFTFFSLQIYSRVSRVMRAITGFITTHLPGVAAPAPLIHNLKRSQKIFQGRLYRIHLIKNGSKWPHPPHSSTTSSDLKRFFQADCTGSTWCDKIKMVILWLEKIVQQSVRST